ncbi:ferredoxin--NADP reductase [Lutibacter sp.]|uniref:ferredoxin--NADP reductase n=1 Tax=Lutibacter sp. TaxID=1925666 RepID=UPI0025B88C55|nr:ferredoxin--NADP reductase [Lutibacter sp.]MCF6181809.1 ferredoxin--NADP reductase [Lutibacter sp.]
MSKFHKLSIKEVIKETENAVSISFNIPTDLKDDFQFVAGQYVTIKTEINGQEIRRAYSICSEPNNNELRIAIKAVKNGTFSVFATSNLKEDDVLEVSKPEGKFLLETSKSNHKNYLGIAAGSGITPIMAMIKTVLTEELNSTFTLVYGNRTLADTIFKKELEQLQNKYANQFFVQYIYSREQQPNALFGRIDEGNLNYVLKNNFKNRTFNTAFLCGPETMIENAKTTLLANGLKEETIHFELFSTPISSKNNISNTFKGSCEITVLVDDEKTTFTMDSKTTILKAALKEGVDAPYSCQGGICSSCMAKITDGSAVMEKNTILTDAEVKDGIVLTCQAHPTSQKITVDYDNV